MRGIKIEKHNKIHIFILLSNPSPAPLGHPLPQEGKGKNLDFTKAHLLDGVFKKEFVYVFGNGRIEIDNKGTSGCTNFKIAAIPIRAITIPANVSTR